MAPSKPKKNTTTTPANPYAKLSYNIGSLNSKQSNSNKITTVKVAADNVFVSWSTRPGAKNVSSYLKPLKDHFELHCNDNEGVLMNTWKISGFLTRREFNQTDPLENKKLTGSPDAAWPWEAIVTLVPPQSDPSPTAVSVGKHVASTFTAFADESKVFGRNKVSFAFHRDASEAEPAPLSRYVLDEDVVQVVKIMYAQQHKKEDVLDNDDLLERFFGDADRGRSLLEFEAWGSQDEY